jgi:hypothetical protein
MQALALSRRSARCAGATRRRCVSPIAILTLVLIVIFPLAASAQSLNIDFGTPESAPGAAYGAAGPAGAWNTIGVLPPWDRAPLIGLDGQPVAAQIYGFGGTAMLVSDDPATSADDAGLVDDMLIGMNDPVDVCIWVEDLVNGFYDVIIYALTPNDPARFHRVRVDDASPPPTMIGGAWPGAHQEGVTFERFTVNVTNGWIGLHSGLYGGNFESGINGIQVIDAATSVGLPSGSAAAPRIERIFPNPAGGAQTFELSLPAGAGAGALEILDVSGRLVWRQPLASLEGGVQRFVWDGRDTSGDAVAQGVYVVRLPSTAGGAALSKLVRVR